VTNVNDLPGVAVGDEDPTVSLNKKPRESNVPVHQKGVRVTSKPKHTQDPLAAKEHAKEKSEDEPKKKRRKK
jgi:hypothetical protein